MYAVVGCGECRALWIVEGRPETSQCPRCRKTRQFSKRRQFATTDTQEAAREARAALLAKRGGYEEEFDDVDSVTELETRVDSAGIDDETYLEASGIDSEDVEAAGDRVHTSGGSHSRDEIIRAALRELDEPTREAVIEYSAERDVSPGDTEALLEKLLRNGEVTEQGGIYRLL